MLLNRADGAIRHLGASRGPKKACFCTNCASYLVLGQWHCATIGISGQTPHYFGLQTMRFWSRYATRVTQGGSRLSWQEQAFSGGWGELYVAVTVLLHFAIHKYKALFQDGLV